MIKSKVTTEEMCHGPLAGNLILYTLPIVLTGILQLLFSAVGMIIVGQFAPEGSLAAIGSTGALINLIINVFLG
ncbi:MAG TPA: MATE family efflux transporter, partial [Bacillota bacterium]|nr:MATE family efflux transporter [Bacillota bacterium]